MERASDRTSVAPSACAIFTAIAGLPSVRSALATHSRIAGSPATDGWLWSSVAPVPHPLASASTHARASWLLRPSG